MALGPLVRPSWSNQANYSGPVDPVGQTDRVPSFSPFFSPALAPATRYRRRLRPMIPAGSGLLCRRRRLQSTRRSLLHHPVQAICRGSLLVAALLTNPNLGFRLIPPPLCSGAHRSCPRCSPGFPASCCSCWCGSVWLGAGCSAGRSSCPPSPPH